MKARRIWLVGSLALLAVSAGVAILLLSGDSTARLPDAASQRAKRGQPYEFQVGHCGLIHIVNFDGDYWDVDPSTMTEAENQRFGINADAGTITLTKDNVAIYRSSAGGDATLHRHTGVKTTFNCM